MAGTTDLTVSVTNAGVTNTLRVLWYLRSARFLRSYSHSTVNGSPTAVWAYTNGSTSMATGIKTATMPRSITAVHRRSTAAWSKVTRYTVPALEHGDGQHPPTRRRARLGPAA